MNIFKGFGLTSRIIALCLLVALIPLSIGIFISYQNSSTELQKLQLKKLKLRSNLAEQDVIRFLKSEVAVIETIALGDTLQAALQDGKDYEVVTGDLNEIMAQIDRERGGYSEIFVMDKTGKIVAGTDKTQLGLDKRDNPFFTEPIKAADHYVKDLYVSPTTGRTEFVIASVVKARLKDNIIGVIAARLYPKVLTDTLVESAKMVGETADVFVVNSENLMMTPSRFEGSTQVLKTRASQTAKECVGGKEITARVMDFRNKEVYGSFSTAAINKELGKNWCVVAKMDAGEVDAPVLALMQILLMVTALSVVGIIIVAFYVGSSISRPIKNVAEQMNASATQLSASAQQTAASSSQNSSIAQQVAATSTQQSRQAEEVSNTVSQMAAAIQQMSSSAQDASASASGTSKVAQQAGVKGEQSQKSLQEIKKLVADTAAMIKTMSTRSESIGEIVATITGIAEQTNLLALNAAIEAARAGDAGRGFAVVADEVRKLAEESAKAAEKIKTQISEMIAQIDDTVTSVQNGVKTTEDGSKTITDTLSDLQSISLSIQQVSAKMQEISAGAQQQSSSVQQLSKATEQFAASAEQNASGSQQLSSSTQQQSSATRQVASTAQQLTALARQLQKLAGTKEAKAPEEPKATDKPEPEKTPPADTKADAKDKS